MRNVALISQGPLTCHRYHDGESAYDAVIGVNCVPTLYRCDYWVCADWRPFGQYIDGGEVSGKSFGPVIGDPVPVSRVNTRNVMPEREPQTWDRIRDRLICHDVFKVEYAYCKSGLLALCFAHYLHPERIDCFGCDMTDSVDCAGRRDDWQRNDLRWRDERQHWTRVVRRCEQESIEVWHADPGSDGMFRWLDREEFGDG